MQLNLPALCRLQTPASVVKQYTSYIIFIAMQPLKVEMIQDNYTTLQNIKHQLYYSHSHSQN